MEDGSQEWKVGIKKHKTFFQEEVLFMSSVQQQLNSNVHKKAFVFEPKSNCFPKPNRLQSYNKLLVCLSLQCCNVHVWGTVAYTSY